MNFWPTSSKFKSDPFGPQLFNFGFFEFDVLAHLRIVLANGHLFRRILSVLLGRVEETGTRRADEFDQDRGGLCHGISLSLRVSREPGT